MSKCCGRVDSNYDHHVLTFNESGLEVGTHHFVTRTDSYVVPFSVHIKVQTLQSGLASSYNICTLIYTVLRSLCTVPVTLLRRLIFIAPKFRAPTALRKLSQILGSFGTKKKCYLVLIKIVVVVGCVTLS
jgi:hypothetical protein